MQRITKYGLMVKEYHKSLISYEKECLETKNITTNSELATLISNTKQAQEQFASLCSYANSIVKDVEDREKSDRIHRKFPNLLSEGKTYDQNGLCRLDSDLQTTFYDTSSNKQTLKKNRKTNKHLE